MTRKRVKRQHGKSRRQLHKKEELDEEIREEDYNSIEDALFPFYEDYGYDEDARLKQISSCEKSPLP